MDRDAVSRAHMLRALARAQRDALAQVPVQGMPLTLEPPGHPPAAVYVHRAAGASSPTVFELHGGGFALGDARATDSIRQYLCRTINVNVVGISYCKTPQFPYPAAVDQVFAVLNYFAEHAASYQLDPARFAVMGYSCGANLAAVTAMRAAHEPCGFSLRAQVLHYPYLNVVPPPAGTDTISDRLPAELLTAFVEAYAPPERRREPFCSPLCAPEALLQNGPPALIMPARNDALRTDALAYAQKLTAAGVPTETDTSEDTHHGYIEDHFCPALYALSFPDGRESHPAAFHRQAVRAMHRSAQFLSTHFA